ncbi:AbrB family transcriptional regulator, stage V sporulation protein T [Melghirimyces algeriensis]|uniref:AbrB family transcriptional regulator, stage V sporulation protein T n=2 Tax=Melghirimyces algeriensis TaxID=910412 RepID=A0A521EAH7_9BACL|nr:AbrB family transcriptional regulator, stage V sporulation protein T [Melghirimyces algeriensis]
MVNTGKRKRIGLIRKNYRESEAAISMKATGIVRRIDDLGRVVIPKEIRRTLRIREGDPLEIFVDRDGEVILKKYSPIGELSDFSKDYADAIFESLQHITLICDRDSVISVAGASKKEYQDKPVGEIVENCMEQRKPYQEISPARVELIRDMPESYESYIIVPINAGGDPVGAVILLSKEEDRKMGELEMKMASTAAAFLGKQMEH